jgi:hypothetical protein
VFWTFVIGPLGAILSIPLTLTARELLLADGPGWLRWLSGNAALTGPPDAAGPDAAPDAVGSETARTADSEHSADERA